MIQTNFQPESYEETLSGIESNWILSRIWSHDHTVWRDDPSEIATRLGWLHAPETMIGKLDRLDRLSAAARADRFRHVLLLGMGGSSLAPETLAQTFGHAPGSPDLTILDSTHPDSVLDVERRLDLQRTLVIVATKSGTTTETLSLFRYFYGRIVASGGAADIGRRFVAITDPGSPLVHLAERHSFREILLNDPNIGGRYAALSYFGFVPAALLGIDVRVLLNRARDLAIRCAKYRDLRNNPAVQLGVLLGSWAVEGRDKATFVISDAAAAFGAWVEQLIAESTGKEGTGILPVVGERLGSPSVYGDDRVFVHLRVAGDDAQDGAVDELGRGGYPIVRVDLADTAAIGGQFFLWELATAIAGHVLGINPFDQPNVEAAKAFARELPNAYRQTGEIDRLDQEHLTPTALDAFLADLSAGDYVAIQAYLAPKPEVMSALRALQVEIRTRHRVATTVGYGPRFLHSTGQLHKGDRGNGRFIQLLSSSREDVGIPDETGLTDSSLSFGELISAQALGDRRALADAGRPTVAFTLSSKPQEDLTTFLAGLSAQPPVTD